ncbi:MAG TPA: peptidase S8, partial [Cytophagales bacterium]|nr:peptidase S8 [Cytophagales bacterium]
PVAAASVVASGAVSPSAVDPSCGCNSDGQQLVYALGSLGIDFGTDAVLDSFKFYMKAMDIQDKDGNVVEYPNPNDPYQLLKYLEANPFDASRVIWTMNHDNTPIYAIKPSNAFEVEIYKTLCEFLDPGQDEAPKKTTKGAKAEEKKAVTKEESVHIDMISVPGVIDGQIKLLSGQVIPVIRPHLRAMYNWRTLDLVRDTVEIIDNDGIDENDGKWREGISARILNFVNRIYFELQNLGVSSGDRALNYAATNIFNVGDKISLELSGGYVLKSISVAKSSICRPNSDCQDVIISFFNPMNRQKYAPKVWRFTIDVSKEIPVAIGEPRSWYIFG